MPCHIKCPDNWKVTALDHCTWVIIHNLTGNNNNINSDLKTSLLNLSALSFTQNGNTVIWKKAVYPPAICAALKILQHPEHLWLGPQVDPAADKSSDPLQCTTH